MSGGRHVDSAQMYRNENAVGQAVKESGLKREDIFVSKLCSTRSYFIICLCFLGLAVEVDSHLFPATKCGSRSHGYESTLKGVDDSLAKFGFGEKVLFDRF